jgi:hypothetical protein
VPTRPITDAIEAHLTEEQLGDDGDDGVSGCYLPGATSCGSQWRSGATVRICLLLRVPLVPACLSP